FIGQAANELEFKLRREFEQIELLRDIESLNRIIAATRQSCEVEAQRQQFELIEERMAVIEAGQPAQERLVERMRQSVEDTADLCAKLCPIGSSQNRTPAAFERATTVEASNRIAASGNALAFSFNLDQMRRQQTVGFSQTATGARADEPLVNLPGFLGDRRFNVFAAGDVSFSDDSRRVGQDGVTFSISGGFSWLAAEGVNLGLAGRFTDTDIDGASGSISGDTFSLAAFAQTTVLDGLRLDAIAAYGNSSIDAEFVSGGARADADIDAEAISVQVKASRSFDFDGVAVTPSGSLTYSHVKRDSFTLSNGQTAASSTDDVVTASGGVSVGTTFLSDDGAMLITPSLSVGGFAGLTDGGGGASISGGLGIRTLDGLSANLSAGFSGFNSGQDVFSLGLNLTVPLN
ncbi:MAG: autotransporter outer membrane beta-barrel domain-containing protein, partial [Pseudomonadota bacterium]